MSIGSTPPLSEVAGLPLAFRAGSEVERAAHSAATQASAADSDRLATAAESIVATEGDLELGDQGDSDGRLPWKRPGSPSVADLGPLGGTASGDAAIGQTLDLLA
jgi:hypothetical protein